MICTILKRATMRNLMEDLRSIGLNTGGQAPLSLKTGTLCRKLDVLFKNIKKTER
jgi:uncharacterized protein YaiI (UPF0178 family)